LSTKGSYSIQSAQRIYRQQHDVHTDSSMTYLQTAAQRTYREQHNVPTDSSTSPELRFIVNNWTLNFTNLFSFLQHSGT